MLNTIHRDSMMARMCTPHPADLAPNGLRRVRTEQLSDADPHSMSHGLQLILLELEDREEWKIAAGLRRKIAGTQGISVF